MMTDDFAGGEEALRFLPEHHADGDGNAPAPWKVMIVDDEPGVHAATRLALRGISFRGRGLQFISAYSGKEALEKLRENDDTAMIFLDVVMETSSAGLVAARQIREEGFNLVRIVLRTGHPGYAPEREVVVNYDIHDYKEKSSLDFSKLFTCLISALRAYDDLVAIEQHRRGLLSVLEAVSWFDFRSLKRYLSRMLAELSTIANIEVGQLLLAAAGPNRSAPEFTVLIDGLADPLSASERDFIGTSLAQRRAQGGELGATFVVDAFGIDLALFTRDRQGLANADRVLLELFLNKVAQALDNHHTFAEVLGERDSLVRAFADPSQYWGGHDCRELESLQRLARETAARLQQRLDFPGEIDDWFVFSIGTAGGFHDLGMQTLPHQLFEKPGALSAEERRSVEQHARNGVELLRSKLGNMQGSRLFAMSESVILQHHERYDGSGYPAGLAGAEISLPARIIAVIDCFVAMTAPRPYRAACARQEALRHLRDGRGSLFDPAVVDAFLDVIDQRN
ncbi:MAG TPA: HD domain-containing phosphohydrolase [Rhodocyclaceae bacterium]|nr:HD domain-containing phosphohydrolase [Rhodocyclaceae bacterium]